MLRKTGLIILTMALTMGVLTATAGEKEEPRLHQMYHIKIKPGHHKAFYEDLAKHSAWRREEGDPWTWWVHRVVNGINDGDCIIRSGALHWADIDEYADFGPKGGDKFWEDVGKHIADSHSWLSMDSERFARWHPDMSKVKLISVINYQLNPGMEKTFFDGVKIYHDAIVEHDYPTYYHFSWLVNGGRGGTVSLAIFHENWADMGTPEEKMSDFMSRVLDEDKVKEAMDAFSSATKYTESTIVQYIPELSIKQD